MELVGTAASASGVASVTIASVAHPTVRWEAR
jgi:hypothetical protein